MIFRPYPVLTLAVIASLVILVVLGNWQYSRYSDKLGATADELPATEMLVADVVALPGKTVQSVYGMADGEPIWRRYVLATRISDQKTLLVAADATGGARPVPIPVPGGQRIEAEMRVFQREGRVSARNEPGTDSWYVFDRAGILSAYGLGDSDIPVAEPVNLTVRNADDLSQVRLTVNPYAAPVPIDPLPPERHLGYALTWWGLALALLAVYLVYHHSNGRLRLKTAK